MSALTLSADEDLSDITASLVGQVALVAHEVSWLDIANGQGVHCATDSGDTVLGTTSNNHPILEPCHGGDGGYHCANTLRLRQSRG